MIFQFKIKQRVSFLIGLVLTLELLFTFCALWLISETETEAQKTETSRRMVSKTNQYVSAVYTVLHRLGKYADYKSNLEWLQAVQEAQSDEKSKFDALLKACEKDSESKVYLQRLKQDMNKTVALFVNISDAEDPTRAQRNESWFRNRVDNFIGELAQFNERQGQFQLDSFELQQQLRNQFKCLLVIGVIANVLAAIFLGIQLNRHILLRVDKIIDNTKRMRHKLPLHSQMEADDEIGELDAAFHQMAQTLQNEQKLLLESEARLRSFMGNVPIGLMALNKNGTIEIANEPLAKMFDCTTRELTGREIGSLFTMGDCAPQVFWEKVREDALGHPIEVTTRAANDREFTSELCLSVDSVERQRYLASVANVEERHQLELLKQAVVAMVSHDLRTPLTSISGFLRMLVAGSFGEISENIRSRAEGAESNTKRLIGLVNDLLDLEKLQSGTITVAKVPCDLGILFKEALNAVATYAANQSVSVVVPAK
jgi:PAS domain-containing protein